METYIVQFGDTVDSIAQNYNVNPGDIINANNLQMPYNLMQGQSLIIPINSSNVFDYYTIQKNDTLFGIANKYGTTVDLIAMINGIKPTEYIYPGQTLLVPKRGTSVYITQVGDTLGMVANNMGVTEGQLIRDNRGIYLLPEQLIVARQNI